MTSIRRLVAAGAVPCALLTSAVGGQECKPDEQTTWWPRFVQKYTNAMTAAFATAIGERVKGSDSISGVSLTPCVR